MAKEDVVTTFGGDAKPLEDVLKRLTKEMRRFATIAEKEVANLQGGFNKATASSAKLEAQQKKTNAQLEKAAKPQSTKSSSQGFIGPKLPMTVADVKKINAAMAQSTREAKETRKQIEARVKQELLSLKNNQQTAKAMGQVGNSAKGAATSTKNVSRNLQALSSPALRYALYDVANSIKRISAALAAAAVAPVAFNIKYQRNFADVIRTNEIAGDSSEKLRKQLQSDLQEVAQSSPISWKDITDIAALAGQLGIAQELVAGFTENVAKFSATTDLSVDAAATAFGRLNELVDGVNGQFDKLGSAILAVGVDSVATESGIVNVSQQIASMGNLAGLSAADIVGLSGALASLGIRPELARGNVTRLFSSINKAVAESGFALTEYGRLTGRTAQGFADSWSSEPTEVLLDFFEGLQNEGSKAERTLRDIGITSVRDIPAFLRLGQNVDLVRRLVSLSNEEFEKGQKINEQYAIISGTTAEQLKRLGQNFELLLSSLGSLEGPFAVLLGILNAATETLTDFASTPWGADIAAIGGTVVLLGAAFTAVAAAAAFALAGLIAFRFVAKDLNLDLSALTLNSFRAGRALDALGLSALRTSKAFTTLKFVAKGFAITLGVIGAALLLGGLAYNKYKKDQDAVAAVTNNLLSDTEKLSEALEADQKIVERGGEAFRTISESQRDAEGSAIDLADIYRDLSRPLETIIKAQAESAGATELQIQSSKKFLNTQRDANGAIFENVKILERQAEAAAEAANEIFTLGENFALYLQKQAAADPEVQAAFAIPEVKQGVIDEFGSFPSFLDQLIGDPEDAKKRVQDIFFEIQVGLLDKNPTEMLLEGVDIRRFQEDVAAAELTIDGLIGSVETDAFLNAALGVNVLADGLNDAAEAADIADGKVSILLDEIFGSENAIGKANDAINQFFADINNGADTADITGESLQGMVEAISGNSFRTPRERIADLNEVLAQLERKSLGTSAYADAVRGAMIRLAYAASLTDSSFGTLPEAFSSTNAQLAAMLENVAPLAGIFEAVTGTVIETEKSFSGAAAAVKTLAEEFDDLLNSIFDPVNAARAQAEAIVGLGEAYAELGSGAFYASGEIEDAVRSITDSAESPEQAIANLNSLFNQLASTVGSSTDPSLAFLRQTIDSVAQSFGIAGAEVAQFANIDLSFFQSGIESVQKEVRTLLDYASDLESVFDRAFDIRFASTFAIDNIAEAWFKLGENVEKAQREVEDLIASQQDLGADRALKEYFLSVADAYDDTLRAAQLRKEIADLERQQADDEIELDRARALSGGATDLTGQTEGGRQNRAALLGLVGDYQSYIGTLAESGASQDELRKATERARKEFIAQALELGYQEDVVLEYAKAFDDVRTAIDNVPRNITVDANVNPALQALNELNASLQTQIRAANDLNRALNQPVSAPSGGNGGKVEIVDRYEVIVRAKQAAGIGLSTPVASMTRAQRAAIGLPYYDGGFTGRGGAMDPAGIVHKGEYVVPQKYVNQSTGMPDPNFLAQLQNGMRGYQMGGFVGGASSGNDSGTMMVELSPYDRKLLSDAGNVQLRLNGKVVAEATNRSNVVDAQRGAN